MINGKHIAVVMPAYNAAKTLERTVLEIPDTVDERILVDDHSGDDTVAVAKRLGLRVLEHDRNYGYGRNQKTCDAEALARGADVVVMVHPDSVRKCVVTLVSRMAAKIGVQSALYKA